MREPIVELEDEDFLYHVAAAEAEALSAKRRKISITTSAEEKKAAEGVYTAALKGSKSVLFQQQSSIRSNRGLKLVTAGNNHNMFASPEFGGGGGGGIPAAGDGGSCFKCGKTGHWARDCGDSNSKSYGIDAAAGGGGSCFKCGKSGHWARDCGDSNSNFNSNVIDHSVPEKACPCGIGTCLVLTANTDKNRGRKFYKCHVREENGGCGFFEWCDKDEGTNTLTLGSQSLASNPGVPDLSCPCGAGSCLILTAKTGKNIGQAFYRCPANQGSSCGFFKWCHDQTAANSPSNEASKKGFGIRSGSSCFRCGKDGHWAKDCILPSMQNPAYQGGRSA